MVIEFTFNIFRCFFSKIRMTMRMYILNLLKGKISPEYILYPQDSGSLLYPSVTFCTKYIWQSFPGVSKLFFPLKFSYSLSSLNLLSLLLCLKVLELLNKNKSLDFEALKTFAQEDFWSRDKVAVRNRFFSLHLRCFKSLTGERLKINWV